ncbi:3D domain-containing protein [Brevibacillus sp. SYSU BS000544]|uniref:3D domain-containing protein n=1 Tax=Brevibacillus sp. SYSU BS000544 TaxID=3416443 RepID=UPI003CE4E1F1
MKKSFSRTLLAVSLGLLLTGMSSSAFAAEDTHVIAKGDTFWKISKLYQLSLKELLKANDEKDPNRLVPGAVIQLPEQPKQQEVPQPKALSAEKKEQAAKAVPTVTTYAGKTVHYERIIAAKATAYTASAAENGGYAGRDYFGNQLKVGSIAVDPSIIPLGSTVYITGYKANPVIGSGIMGKAVDIGSAVKGPKVDIFIPGLEHAIDFGIQNVKVYVLKK